MHRWNWLLTELVNPKSYDSAAWGIELIKSWLTVQGSTKLILPVKVIQWVSVYVIKELG